MSSVSDRIENARHHFPFPFPFPFPSPFLVRSFISSLFLSLYRQHIRTPFASFVLLLWVFVFFQSAVPASTLPVLSCSIKSSACNIGAPLHASRHQSCSRAARVDLNLIHLETAALLSTSTLYHILIPCCVVTASAIRNALVIEEIPIIELL
ncbi:hypothetical protein VTL71DRAFT_4162 [Oculimacula yallundae]|uniref:Transmembrane protein n=1 Tax=Oculimacula yallundae TaxID=86028 RepID=A0ABR4C5T5_9HELO